MALCSGWSMACGRSGIMCFTAVTTVHRMLDETSCDHRSLVILHTKGAGRPVGQVVGVDLRGEGAVSELLDQVWR
jgi:hypothetical protein